MTQSLFVAYSGKHFQVSESFNAELRKVYPHVDLIEEYQRMEMWLTANPKRKKKNFSRFIVNWLMKQPKPEKELRVGMGPSDMGYEIRVKVK